MDEINKLCFHTSSVTQLCWAPSAIKVPILLSVNSDELVWWNVTLSSYIRKSKWPSVRMNRTISTPSVGIEESISPYMTPSQSIDSYICNMQNQIESEIDKVTKFWKSKESKDPNKPALLAVVELPSNFFAKVCISADFTKFVTVDIYGSISTFTLCGYD